MVDYRTSKFRLEQIHGKEPNERSLEAKIRNYIFGVRILQINTSENNKTTIRIVGYEVPIYSGEENRVECMDLLGYDRQHRPWIIELKQKDSQNSIEDAVDQVERYAKAFEKGIRQALQEELRERLLWPEFSFQGEAQRMVLADRAFYLGREQEIKQYDTIYFCSFAYVYNERTLKDSSRDVLGLRVMG